MFRKNNSQFKKTLFNYRKVLRLTEKHNKFFSQTINLIASENTPSLPIMKVLSSDFNNRVAEGWIRERCYPGMQNYDAIEEIGIKVAKELFNYKHVDIRPISGTIANMAVYTAFTKPGDKVMSISIKDGAHISMAGILLENVFGLNLISIPFSIDLMNIDLTKTIRLIKKNKPKLVILGGSVILFPQPVRDIVKVAHKTQSLVVYDASHVAGLIAGGKFQNPYKDEVDIVTFTTCKTIPGPQSAVILSKKKYSEELKKAVFPTLVSGHHLHETVGAVLALLELKVFGKKYASDTIKNAQRLGEELLKRGFNVLTSDKGCTMSHMILLDCGNMGGGFTVEKKLEAANIIVNRNILPGSNAHFKRPNGIRIGTQEVTHIGMSQFEMLAIADFFKRLLINREPTRKIKKEIINFRRKFQEVKYCFGEKDI